MNAVDLFLNDLERSGFWEDECASCGKTFNDTESKGVCEECIIEECRCPGCACEPGSGYTAGCHHPEGCGYFKATMGALSSRLPEE